ncbi:type I restriction endonuclease subunit M [Streptomyces sp. CS090A]|uniref:DinB family protein n=1 Tax=Streptomyces sp. CS090A TaxID=2162710 RepID=UPI000D50F087|nr:DinB family protein [Streptomyces sp. CS090A]PVD01655.1 type I restriction endonuclease subunit M [Streptomyces sp. CS090A]
MIDEFAKTSLHGRLRRDCKALLWKLDGLSECDAGRPLTVTGTNLLGLVKHVASVEARYVGEVFDRPSPEPLARWQDHDGSDLWTAEDEARAQIIESCRRTWEHSDATIGELALDVPGHVPWWPEPYANTNLFAILVHVLGETNWHAGRADILREAVDGRTGMRPEHEMQIDEEARTSCCAKIEQAAGSAESVTALFGRHDASRAGSPRDMPRTAFARSARFSREWHPAG